MNLIYPGMVDYIQSFLNSDDLLRYMMLGVTLIDHKITDENLISKGFLGFRFTHLTSKTNYSKLYIYINTDFLSYDNFKENISEMKCILVLLEEGILDLKDLYIPDNTTIQMDKSSKYRLYDKNLYFTSEVSYLHFNVKKDKCHIIINKISTLRTLRDMINLCKMNRFDLKINFIEVNIDGYRDYALSKLQEVFTYLEDVEFDYKKSDINIVISDIDNLVYVLYNHLQNLRLGYLYSSELNKDINLYIHCNNHENLLGYKSKKYNVKSILDGLKQYYISVNIVE